MRRITRRESLTVGAKTAIMLPPQLSDRDQTPHRQDIERFEPWGQLTDAFEGFQMGLRPGMLETNEVEEDEIFSIYFAMLDFENESTRTT